MGDDETARHIIDIAWTEFTKTVDAPHMPIHPEMRALMMSLVTSGIKVEREACLKIAESDRDPHWRDAIPNSAARIAEKIRARGQE
jgi:hypothetical protein